jgi:hypothetical protein
MCELRSTDWGGCANFVAGFIRGLTERLDRLAKQGQHRLAAHLADAEAGVLESMEADSTKVVIEPSAIAPLKLNERLPAQVV